MLLAMWHLLKLTTISLRCIPALFRSRSKQAIVELALRQQLATFVQKGSRARITPADRGFWVFLSQVWSGWKEILVIVQPETVVRWHRKGFRLYWRSISKRGPHSQTTSAPLRFQQRCRPSFVDSQLRTAGVPERFGLNSKNLGSRSASRLYLDISRSEILTMINANGGERSFALTGTASPRWTSLSSPPFGSDCYTPGS